MARIVVPNTPHHVIQRGNRNQRVFFEDDDRRIYLEILGSFCRREKIKIWCYCLMDNHVHLIAVPGEPGNLRRAIGETHKKYTSMINGRYNWKGHLWQGRFLSYPLDETHLYNCMKYIERNPVRAGLVSRPEYYPWSSAAAHVFGIPDEILSPLPRAFQIEDWPAYLGSKETEKEIYTFREHARSGKPLGDEAFIKKLESCLGVKIQGRKPGRPKKEHPPLNT